jgi:predicted lipid-binding transport protein (Tim44 family)
VGSSVARGLLVGIGVLIATSFFGLPTFVAPAWTLLFAVLGALFYWWQMRQIRRDRSRAAAERLDKEGEQR